MSKNRNKRTNILRTKDVNVNGNDTLRYDTAQAPTIRPAGYDKEGQGDKGQGKRDFL